MARFSFITMARVLGAGTVFETPLHFRPYNELPTHCCFQKTHP